jgi:SAM-dependent methyltransferase
MNILSDLKKRSCPVCGSGPDCASPHIEQHIDPTRLSSFSFASRKEPEFMTYGFVLCQVCDTVYAAEAPPPNLLATAYRDSGYDSGHEAQLAAEAYSHALSPHLATEIPRGIALEIGAGNGTFLTKLASLGFDKVIGVEPSHAAIESAPPDVKNMIRTGIFQEQDFAPASMSLICCFQTLEHVSDPRGLGEAAYRLLMPGGMLALVTHDRKAWINRLLGRHSPIVDIEHLQIFCNESLTYLLSKGGYSHISIASFYNRYPINYWMRLSPAPPTIKKIMAKAFAGSGLGQIPLSVNVGNLLAIGRRPFDSTAPIT